MDSIWRELSLTQVKGGLEEVDNILLFDRAVPESRPEGLDDRVTFQSGDISDRDTIFGLVDRDDISVFHLASVVSAGGKRDFDLAMRVNLEGGRNIFEAVRARGGMPRVVFASSVAVFGGSAMPPRVGDFTKQSPHAMRHTAVTRFSAAVGGDAAMVQQFSGHQSLAMLLRYTHPADERVDAMLDSMHESPKGASVIKNLKAMEGEKF